MLPTLNDEEPKIETLNKWEDRGLRLAVIVCGPGSCNGIMPTGTKIGSILSNLRSSGKKQEQESSQYLAKVLTIRREHHLAVVVIDPGS